MSKSSYIVRVTIKTSTKQKKRDIKNLVQGALDRYANSISCDVVSAKATTVDAQ